MSFQYGKYKIISEVGNGGFGRIFYAEKENDKTGYILKTLKENPTLEDINNFKKK